MSEKLYSEKAIHDSVYSYLNTTSTIYQCTDDFLHKHWYDILNDAKKELKDKNKYDFYSEHLGIFYLIFGTLCTILIITFFVIGGFISYKINIAEISEKARICVETGYGCESNTINKDIKYDNTPIIEVNK